MIYINARAIIEREGPEGTEILLQVRDRPGEPKRWEFPGGRLEEFEPVLDALRREVLEETGLTVTELLDETNHVVWRQGETAVECLTPYFVYQTLKGPVDAAGFYFRCRAEGELTQRGDGASGHRWHPIAALRKQFAEAPEGFDWGAGGALAFYLRRQSA